MWKEKWDKGEEWLYSNSLWLPWEAVTDSVFLTPIESSKCVDNAISLSWMGVYFFTFLNMFSKNSHLKSWYYQGTCILKGNPRKRQFGIKFVYSGLNRGEASAHDVDPSLKPLCLRSSSSPQHLDASLQHHAGAVPPVLDPSPLGTASLCFVPCMWPSEGPWGS